MSQFIAALTQIFGRNLFRCTLPEDPKDLLQEATLSNLMWSEDLPHKQIPLFHKSHKKQLCRLLSCSAHRTPNFTNPKFQFSQFKVLQSVFFFLTYYKLYRHFWVYFDINLKLLSGKNTQKVNKQKIRSKNSGFVLVVRMSWTR